MNPEIRYVERGLAARFGDGHIEMHKDLLKYPELHDPILQHELEHHSGGATWHDFKHDMFPGIKLNRWQLWKFVLKRPSTWITFLPLYHDKSKGWVIDTNKCIKCAIILALIPIVFWIDYWLILKIINLKGGI